MNFNEISASPHSARKFWQSVTASQRSTYSVVPSKNLKFERFLTELFKSTKPAKEVKDEIIKYVQAMETNYIELIRGLRDKITLDSKQHKQTKSAITNEKMHRNELECLFVDCIEEVRKEIMRRRLKNEIYTRKRFHNVDQSQQEAKDFEESLLRLAQLAKNRVRLMDFTQKDKYHLLDLFVNNEKTLLKIYEALFPHRSVNIMQSNELPMSPVSQMEIPPRENKSLISTAMPVLPATTNRDRRQPFSQGGRDHAQSRSLAPSSGGLVGGRY